MISKNRRPWSVLVALVFAACGAADQANERDGMVATSGDASGSHDGGAGADGDHDAGVASDASADADADADADAPSVDAGINPNALALPAGSWFNVDLGTVRIPDSRATLRVSPLVGFAPYRDAVYDVLEHDNDAHWFVLGTADAAYWNAGGYTRWAWTQVGDDGFYICAVSPELPTLAGALAFHAPVDTTDPASRGCNGAPWLFLQRALAITGFYEPLDIHSHTLGGTEIVSYDNAARTIELATNKPGEHARVLWTGPVEDGSVYSCLVDPVIEDTTPAFPSNESDLVTGCVGNSWTRYLPWIEPYTWSGFFSTRAATSYIQFAGRFISRLTPEGGTYDVRSTDNRARTAILSQPGVEVLDTYVKLFWTQLDEKAQEFFFCIPGQANADMASVASWTADVSNLSTGCNGGPWTLARVAAKETVGYRIGGVPISSFVWGTDEVVELSTRYQTAITHGPAGYKRVTWMLDQAVLYWCASGPQPTAVAARTLVAAPNRGSLAAGCYGGAWSDETL